MNGCRRAASGPFIATSFLALALVGCERRGPTGPGTARVSPQPLAPSAPAAHAVQTLQKRFGIGGPVAAAAAGFEADAAGVRPRFGAAAAAATARLVLSKKANAPFRLEDASSGTAIEVSLDGAGDVAAEVAGGYVVYRGAHGGRADVLHRALPAGTEDYVTFESAPGSPFVKYQVKLAQGVAGLRLVANTLEVLDKGGAPRLRVSPPFLVGADGERTNASLSVAGCAVDTDPASPWGRAVVSPGASVCTVVVSWANDEVAYPAVLDPRWATTSSMGTPRQGHTVTMMSNGRVLIVGGKNGSAVLETAELFDPATGTWAATQSMPAAQARQLHTATQLRTSSNPTTSGKILIAGGANATEISLQSAQLYSPESGTWAGATNLNPARHWHTATLLPNGNVLLVGGQVTTATGTTIHNAGAVYVPSSGTGSWVPTSQMATRRRYHTATLMVVPNNSTLNNKVMIVGGNSGGTTSVSSVQVFDGTSRWNTGTALPAAREGQTATALADGKVLIAGGRTNSSVLDTTFVFTPAASGYTGSWAPSGTMNSRRQFHSATLLPSAVVTQGQVLVAGGRSDSASLSSAEVWDGVTTWTPTTPLSTAVQAHEAILLPNNNTVLIAGGSDGTASVGSAPIYDPSFALGCTSNSQCVSGFCVDGVCCDTACTDACGACNLPGSLGTCSPVTGGTCRGAAGVCDAAETCDGMSLACPADLPAPNGTECTDGNACTLGDTCQNGTCAAGPPQTCVAADECHAAGVCDPATGTCSSPPKENGAQCNLDGDLCTEDTCQAGVCTEGGRKACPGGDQCHDAACDPASGACAAPTNKADGTGCDVDGSLCTQDTCQSGTCTVGAAKTCTALSQCHFAGTCDSATGVCSNPAKPNGYGCNDGNACTQGDSCDAGVCLPGAPIVCIATDPCHTDGTCMPAVGKCTYPVAPNGTTCDDGNLCTTNDSCSNGVCAGGSVALSCEAGDPCHYDGTCDPGTGQCTNNLKSGGTCSSGAYQYDGAGRQVRDGEATLQYDAYDQLIGVEVPGWRPTGYVEIADVGGTERPVSIATSINASGTVVGFTTLRNDMGYPGGGKTSFGFQQDGAVAVTLPIPGVNAYVRDNNDLGVAVGASGLGTEENNPDRPIRLLPDGTVEVLAHAGTGQIAYGAASAVNSRGQIAGWAHFYDMVDGVLRWHVAGFRTRADGMMVPLGTVLPPTPSPNGYMYEEATAINDDGVVVGLAQNASTRVATIAFDNDGVGGNVQDLNQFLPPDTGWHLNRAYGINGDLIVGWGIHNGSGRGFRFNIATGEIVDVGYVTQTVSGVSLGAGINVQALGVNAQGVVVGGIFDAGPSWSHLAFVYSDEIGFVDLNTLIDPALGWDLRVASAINDAGEIVGHGYHNGVQRGFKIKLDIPHMSSGRPAVSMRHTYGYDGLRTMTTTKPGTAAEETQYWFSQDYTERADGTRDHYIRIGDRVVARVSYRPPPGGAPAAGLVRDGPSGVDPDLVARVFLVALLGWGLAVTVAGTVGRKRRRRWVAVVSGPVCLFFVSSCEMFGMRRESAQTLWERVETVFFHGSYSAGPTFITKADGTVYEERRYEPFGVPIDSWTGSGLAGKVAFDKEPLNVLNKMTEPRTEWSYHGARWMVPQTGRWLSPDPAIRMPNAEKIAEPWDLNPYGYAGLNPQLYFDPDGADKVLYSGISPSAMERVFTSPEARQEVSGQVSARTPLRDAQVVTGPGLDQIRTARDQRLAMVGHVVVRDVVVRDDRGRRVTLPETASTVTFQLTQLREVGKGKNKRVVMERVEVSPEQLAHAVPAETQELYLFGCRSRLLAERIKAARPQLRVFGVSSQDGVYERRQEDGSIRLYQAPYGLREPDAWRVQREIEWIEAQAPTDSNLPAGL